MGRLVMCNPTQTPLQGPGKRADIARTCVPPSCKQAAQPNGSRLSCGRPARRRKAVGRQSVPRQGHNTPLPLERSPPVSFKRLLGGVFTRVSQAPGVLEGPVIIGLAIKRPDMKWSHGLPTLTITLERYAEREQRKENALDARPTRSPLVREI